MSDTRMNKQPEITIAGLLELSEWYSRRVRALSEQLKSHGIEPTLMPLTKEEEKVGHVIWHTGTVEDASDSSGSVN